MNEVKWSSTKIKKKYLHIIDFCYNEKSVDYRFYGGKGIGLCKEWLEDPQKFNDWLIQNGYNDSLAIGRRNTNNDFSPENCILTTTREAAKWKSTTTSITVGEITDSGRGWSKRLNLGINHINQYLKANGMEKTVDYIQSILNGEFVFEKKHTSNEITVGKITDSGIGWDRRLNLANGYINRFLQKNGREKTIWYIKEKLKNPGFKIHYTRKKKVIKKEKITKSKVRIKTLYKKFTIEDYSSIDKTNLIQIKRIPRYYITTDSHIYDSVSGKILNEYQSNNGHLFVSIKNDLNIRTTAWVHRLVYEAYYGEIEGGYDIHHFDEDKTNNNINNLQKIKHEEHCREHGTKYSDIITTCPQCGKEFLWTAKKQQSFYSNLNRKRHKNASTQPFCSKSCAGKYGKQFQGTLCEENKAKHIDIDVFFNDKFVDTFDCIEKCSQLLQYEFDLNKYRANEQVKRVLNGERQQYKGYVFKYHN